MPKTLDELLQEFDKEFFYQKDAQPKQLKQFISKAYTAGATNALWRVEEKFNKLKKINKIKEIRKPNGFCAKCKTELINRNKNTIYCSNCSREIKNSRSKKYLRIFNYNKALNDIRQALTTLKQELTKEI
jgi:ribosomal protein L37AE/L43A